MKVSLSILVIGFVFLAPVACRQHPAPSKDAVAEPGISEASSITFDISTIPTTNGSTSFVGTYKSQGKITQFQVVLNPSDKSGSKGSSDLNFSFGKGTIVAVPGSDAGVLLSDLKKVLEAKQMPTKVKRAKELPFSYAMLGENQARDSSGGFSDKPPGNWMAMKIFIESDSGDDEGEVFLNFNLKDGKAEFSEKDPDYGDLVVAKLATVL
jgi:hypothetical protein